MEVDLRFCLDSLPQPNRQAKAASKLQGELITFLYDQLNHFYFNYNNSYSHYTWKGKQAKEPRKMHVEKQI